MPSQPVHGAQTIAQSRVPGRGSTRLRPRSGGEPRQQELGILLACSSGLAWDGPPEIGPFACDAGHSLGSIWSAIRDLFMGRVQVMHTQKQHWLDYDPVALAVLVIGMIGLLALTI